MTGCVVASWVVNKSKLSTLPGFRMRRGSGVRNGMHLNSKRGLYRGWFRRSPVHFATMIVIIMSRIWCMSVVISTIITVKNMAKRFTSAKEGKGSWNYPSPIVFRLDTKLFDNRSANNSSIESPNKKRWYNYTTGNVCSGCITGKKEVYDKHTSH